MTTLEIYRRHAAYYANMVDQLMENPAADEVDRIYLDERDQIGMALERAFEQLNAYGEEPDANEDKLIFFTARLQIITFDMIINRHAGNLVQNLLLTINGGEQ